MWNFFYWNPSPAVFSWNLPFVGRPILWYAVLVALGFFIASLLFLYLLRQDGDLRVRLYAKEIASDATFYLILGSILGARLFHLIFYENRAIWSSDPLLVFKVWEGGLASHGGVMGLLVSLFFLQRRYPFVSWFHLLDQLAIPAGVAAAFIRLGNFFNQEILGTYSELPWAVVFGAPIDGSMPIPRHPVQLYEAAFYLFVFFLLWFLRSALGLRKEGRIAGLALLLIFVFRYLIEFYKEEQSCWMLDPSCKMGQWLTFPLIGMGLWLILRRGKGCRLS